MNKVNEYLDISFKINNRAQEVNFNTLYKECLNKECLNFTFNINFDIRFLY